VCQISYTSISTGFGNVCWETYRENDSEGAKNMDELEEIVELASGERQGEDVKQVREGKSDDTPCHLGGSDGLVESVIQHPFVC
jgi:hypothetical protein